jgi:hypothetical protein
MSDQLPVPPELEHLIEKRENEERRRAGRRSGEDRREADLGPIGGIESVDDLDQVPLQERRSGKQRRQNRERRQAARRKTDTDAQPDATESP